MSEPEQINNQSKLEIVKLNYSSNPWRLLRNGGEVWEPCEFDHPTLGKTVINKPVAGDTKAECIAAALRFLDNRYLRLLKRYQVVFAERLEAAKSEEAAP